MSELAERYKIFSGLIYMDVDYQVEHCPKDQLPFLYRRLMWNIQKGIRLSPESEQGKEYAWIICNLATKCGLDHDSKDIIKDGIEDYYDFITNVELEFAHKVIQDCEHLEVIISYLLTDPDEGFLILEDEDGKLMLD